mmetsp:Transcript_40513/g.101786  ORF Transcript_40513/g.101786 Transcript_40513/m.101786 type:complete len:197 (+) Transcript_40513:53-643(+)
MAGVTGAEMAGVATRSSEEVELYGGAIVCDLPVSFADASNFRDVPDHQEVWVDTPSDRSFIVEILERKAEVPDDQAIDFFLSDLAAFNDAREATVLSRRRAPMEELPGMPAEAICLVGLGEQRVAKFNEACANRVHVHMCAVRLPQQETDILLTLNDPASIDPQSSSGAIPVVQGAEEVFQKALRSLCVRNWELFQ